MPPSPAVDLLQGTLDLLVLRTLQTGPEHGWGIAQRIQQISEDVLRVNQGSLYPALHRLEQKGFAIRLADGNEPHVRVEAELPRQIDARERGEPEIHTLRTDRRAGDRQLDERQEAERGPPATFPCVEKPVLHAQRGIAETRIVLHAPQPDQRSAVEPDLEPVGESRPEHRAEHELSLVGTTAHPRQRVFDAALDLQSAGWDGARAVADAGAVGLDACGLFGDRDGCPERQGRTDRETAARPHLLSRPRTAAGAPARAPSCPSRAPGGAASLRRSAGSGTGW